MAAIFRPSANLVAKLVLIGFACLFGGGIAWWWLWPRMDYARRVGWTVVQPSASRRRPRHRLPVLPHHGGNFGTCQSTAYLDLHDLPFADLDQCGDAGAGATEPCGTQADQMGTRYQLARLRLFQSQHPHRQRGGL